MVQFPTQLQVWTRLSTLVVCLLSICLKSCQAESTCFTSGVTANLREDFGKFGVSTCSSASGNCFESYSGSGDVALYYAGCSECPKWSFKAECKKCNSDKCNKQFYEQIRSKNMLCYSADSDKELGSKKIWCGADTKTCYWTEYTNKYKEKRYIAGCGVGWSEVTKCERSLCNIPDKLRPEGDEVGPPAGGGPPGTKGGGATGKKKRRRRRKGGNTGKKGGKGSRGRNTTETIDYDYDYDYDEGGAGGEGAGGGSGGRRRGRRRGADAGDKKAGLKDSDGDSGSRLHLTCGTVAMIVAAATVAAAVTGLPDPAC